MSKRGRHRAERERDRVGAAWELEPSSVADGRLIARRRYVTNRFGEPVSRLVAVGDDDGDLPAVPAPVSPARR